MYATSNFTGIKKRANHTADTRIVNRSLASDEREKTATPPNVLK